MRFQIKPIVPKCRESFEIEFDKLILRPCTIGEAYVSQPQFVYAVIEGSVYRLMCLPGKRVFVNVATMNRKDEGNADLHSCLTQYADYLYLSN